MFITLYTLVNFLQFIYSVPVEIDIVNFKDNWDFQSTPSQQIVLNSKPTLHNLPPVSNRQAKENPEPLQILSLEPNSKKGDAIGHLGDSVRRKVPCSVCTLGVGLLQSNVAKQEPFELIKSKFVSLCVGFKIQTELVCNGIFDVFGPDVLGALNYTHVGPQEICRMVLGEACDDVPNPLHQWDIPLSYANKPIVADERTPKVGTPSLKVLHISDTHFDPDYTEGSIANCAEPLCCRSYSGLPKDNGVILPAGKWGAYDYCDVPEVLITNMLTNINEQHPDIDYIIWTGDLPPHDIWNQTKNESLNIFRECMLQMKRAFPNIPIFPALGNHEGIPAGNYPPPWNKDEKYSIAWLYEEANKQWKDWLPESEEISILHGGFYSVLIRKGLRLISMNMNYCHSFSWWLFVNSTDPAKELKWLAYQLQEAENNGEKVHIIGHIPPGGTDCLKTWSRNYYNIVNRYESTIAGQFFGHTHADEFEVFYDNENSSRPINVAYIGPSVTPYSGQNPAYRIYYVDGEHDSSTWQVIDHETWIMDLGKANIEAEENPEWFKLYSARQSYDMPNLKPMEWHKLIYRMVHDQSLFEEFYRFYYRDSPVTPTFGNKEKLQILCDLKSGKSQVRHDLCHDLEILIHD